MPTQKDLRQLALVLCPFIEQAVIKKRSMIVIDLDVAELLEMPVGRPGSTQVLLALAMGPSVPVLRATLKPTENEQGLH